MSAAPPSDLGWLASILWPGDGGPTERFLANPSTAAPQLLAPLRPRRAASAAVRRYSDGMDRRHRTEVLLTEAALLAGLGPLFRGRTVVLEARGEGSLVTLLERRLGVGKLRVGVTLGPPRGNRKPVVQLIDHQGRVAAFAKVGWDPLTSSLVGNEARWLERVTAAGPGPLVAPRPLLYLEEGSRTVAVASALPPRRLSRRLGHRQLAEVVGWIAGLAPAAGSVAEWAAARRDELAPYDPHLAALLDRWSTTHPERHRPTAAWHGDLSPWNMATGRRDVRVWDWEVAEAGVPLGLDALHRRYWETSVDGDERAAIDRAARHAEPALRALGLSPGERRLAFDAWLVELVVRVHRQRSPRVRTATAARQLLLPGVEGPMPLPAN